MAFFSVRAAADKRYSFCDLSTPKGGREFSVYEDLRDHLIERGLPADEIAFIHDAETDAQKARLFRRIVVAAGGHKIATPCGPCRQILWEFCGNIEVRMVNPEGESKTFALAGLLPEPFDDKVFL